MQTPLILFFFQYQKLKMQSYTWKPCMPLCITLHKIGISEVTQFLGFYVIYTSELCNQSCPTEWYWKLPFYASLLGYAKSLFCIPYFEVLSLCISGCYNLVLPQQIAQSHIPFLSFHGHLNRDHSNLIFLFYHSMVI